MRHVLGRGWLACILLLTLILPFPALANTLPQPFSLRVEETAGGHTIQRHVGKTEAALRDRLEREPSIPAASSFKDFDTAEQAIAQALHQHAAMIQAWIETAGGSPVKAFTHKADRIVGHGVVRATGQLRDMRAFQVVLRRKAAPGRSIFLLTAYPVP